jgi:hypothetical protein
MNTGNLEWQHQFYLHINAVKRSGVNLTAYGVVCTMVEGAGWGTA